MTRIEQVTACLKSLLREVEGTIEARAARERGGQHVPFHGRLANAMPSVTSYLRRELTHMIEIAEGGSEDPPLRAAARDMMAEATASLKRDAQDRGVTFEGDSDE